MSKNLPATLSDDVRRQLLEEQSGQLSFVEIPRVSIMAAGAGLFEFGDTNETTRDFEAVILSSHGRNTMWDRAYGDTAPDGTPSGPACSSGDGHTGRPREGFKHAALGDGTAGGTESINCGECPYNEWGSVALVGKTGRGKACTNQRSVYLCVPGAELPYELILSPTSLRAFDQYSATLLNQGFPLPSVVTELSQNIVERGTMKWSVATFKMGEQLDDDSFGLIREKMAKYRSATSPRSIAEADWSVEEEDGEDTAPF